ncbi:MAG: TonB-dependent receptor [Rhodospirillaceae bacterium]|nr:TonB-dependent receptor [Rhodospirillaceae bacterium]
MSIRTLSVFGACLLAGAPAATHAAQIEEIIVTARGRAESLLRVPDSVTAFGRTDLARRQVLNFEDVAAATPGVFVINDQDPGTNIITVRGVSTDRLQQASVATVIDGLALGDKELFTQPYYDLERVEILKGPQGALYGKNAIGGVFNIITRAPGDAFEAIAEAEAGNGGNRAVRAAAGGPVANTRLKLRVAGQVQDWDGWIFNTFLGKAVDHQTTRNLRVRAIAEPSDDWSLALSWTANSEDSGAAWLSSNNVTGRFGGKLNGPALTDPFGDYEGVAKRHWYGISLTSDVAIGGGTLSARAGYDHYHKRWSEELDFRNDKPVTFLGLPFFPDGIQPIAQPVDLEIATAELRYTSADDMRLRWIAGAFVQDVTRIRVDDFGPLLFGAEASRFRTPLTQSAAFAQAGYRLSDALDATLAVRYDRVETSEDIRGATTGRPVDRSAATFDQVQPKLSVSWQADAATMLYASIGRGFKPGGFNPQPGPADTFRRIYRSETTTAAEVGAKIAINRLTLTAAAFATRYRNFQYFAFINGNDVTYTAPKVNIQGGEIAIVARPFDPLSFDVSGAYTDAKIGAFRAPDPVTGVGLRDYSGNQAPNSPRYTLMAGAEGVTPLTDALNARVRAEVTVRGKTHFEIDNALYSPAEVALNMRAAIEAERWSIAAWAKNLNDNRWAVSAFGQGQIALLAFLGPNGPFDSFNINRGRQYGVTVKAEF